jgi:succinyl-CoA synthetase alpha subunit
MDLTSMISGLLAAQAGNLQTEVAATMMKSNNAAEKSAVLTLLGAGQPSSASLGNVGAGIGGNLNISA